MKTTKFGKYNTFLFSLLILLNGCSLGVQNETKEPQRVNNIGDSVSNNFNLFYMYASDSADIALLVNDSIPGRLPFSLHVADKGLNKRDSLKGIAEVLNEKSDLEIDEDVNGESYPSREYEAIVNGCSLKIRISTDSEKKFAKVISTNCYGQFKNISLDFLFRGGYFTTE